MKLLGVHETLTHNGNCIIRAAFDVLGQKDQHHLKWARVSLPIIRFKIESNAFHFHWRRAPVNPTVLSVSKQVNLQQRSSTRRFIPLTKFSDLGLIEPLLRAVEAEGYTTPTPVQEQAIPYILEGRDVLGIAQTGTGKTAAFTLPILQRLEESEMYPDNNCTHTLILTPQLEYILLNSEFQMVL